MAAKFDTKSFFINHSEKVVGGIVALLALWGLASASWKHASTVPSELQQNADRVRRAIEAKQFWPEDKQLAFTKDMPDIRYLAGELGHRDDIDYARFTMPVNWHDPLVPPQEKRSNVLVLAPMHPEVAPITVPLAMPPDEEESEDDVTDQEEDSEEETEVDTGRVAAARKYGGDDGTGKDDRGTGGQAGDIAAFLGVGAAGGNMPGFAGGSDDDDDDDNFAGGSSRLAGMMASGHFPGDGVGAIHRTADRKVEWRSGISVRMIVDLQEQRRKIREALHITGDFSEIQHFVDYQQIHIERMEHQNGTWSEWEEMNLEDIGEVLTESLGQDVDIVSPAVTRPELTMPLPRRAAGDWLDEEVSHSMITEFELSEEEQEMQNRIDAMLAADAQKARDAMPPQRKAKKGFTQFLQSRHQLTNMARSGYANREAFGQNMQTRMQQYFSGTGRKFGERRQQIFNKQMEATATADFRLLLVRFIDFTAMRGVEYQYRVRLEMYNPNFQQLADDLESPELAELETIMSAWSASTPAVQVPMKYRNYAKKVKSSRYGQHSVEFGVYYEEDGLLPVMGTMSVDVGMPVGGNQHTERVDLEEQILKGGDVTFVTSELLCGVLSTARLNSRDHGDLSQMLTKFGRKQPVGDLVSLVDTRGDIILRYADEDAAALKSDKETVGYITENYEIWREEEGSEGGLGIGPDGEDYDDSDGVGGLARRKLMGSLGMGTGSALGAVGGHLRNVKKNGKKNSRRNR